ncbi:MAG: hypothetical protein AB7R55_01630 [Gemmatimonadales bacterium]
MSHLRVLLYLATLVSSVAAAQDPGRWRPRQDVLEASRSLGGFTQEERASMSARLEAIEAVFQRVPVLATPRGFDVGSRFIWRQTGLMGDARRGLVSYELRLRFWSPSFEVDPEVAQSIVVTVNSYSAINAGLRAPILREGDEETKLIYHERPVVSTESGWPTGTVVHDGLVPSKPSFTQVLLLRPGESPWVSVSRERYLNARLAEAREGDSVMAQAAERTAYEQWMARAGERKAIRDQMPEATRKVMEQTEVEVTERLRATDAAYRQRIRTAQALSLTPKLRATLAALSPAERAAPAWINPGASSYFDFVDPGSPGAQRVVSANPGLYRTRGSRVAVRVLNLYFEQDAPNDHHGWAALDRAIYEVYRTLDWEALARLLEPEEAR